MAKMTDRLSALTSSRRHFLRHTLGAAALAGTSSFILLRRAAAEDAGLVALVHTQAAGDNGPIDSMIAAVKKLSRERGIPTRVVYAQDPATYESIFRNFADAGAAVIVSTFFEVAEPFKALAPSYPDTKWIQILGDPLDPPMPNVETVFYDYYLGCYLSGLFAGKISKTGKIGYIGGVSIPPLNANLNAIKAGASSVGPNISITSAFAGSFQDPARGHEIASQMYQDGIDYIQTDSAATDTGIIQAANEGDGRMVSAISPEQYKLGPKTVIALVVLDFGRSLYLEVSKALSPQFRGGHVISGLGTDVVDFVLSPIFIEEGPADLAAKAKQIWPEIEQARNEILAGRLKVPFKTEL
jgi:basic membrane protein A